MSINYYFASKHNFDCWYMEPRVPLNKYNCEDFQIPRICVSQSINGCLTALCGRLDIGDVVYIHKCTSCNVMQPTVEQVIDVCFTGEQWILEPVVMNLFMKVKITGIMYYKINNMDNMLYSFQLYEEENDV